MQLYRANIYPIGMSTFSVKTTFKKLISKASLMAMIPMVMFFSIFTHMIVVTCISGMPASLVASECDDTGDSSDPGPSATPSTDDKTTSNE